MGILGDNGLNLLIIIIYIYRHEISYLAFKEIPAEFSY